MTRKKLNQVNEVMFAVEEIQTLHEFRAVAIALQKQVSDLQAMKNQLSESNDNLSLQIETLKNRIGDLETELDDREEDGYNRGYDDGQASCHGEYDSGHSDGYDEGFRDGLNTVEDNRP